MLVYSKIQVHAFSILQKPVKDHSIQVSDAPI